MRAVILGSAHKVFCAGLDLDIVRGKPGIETKKFLERLYFALNDTNTAWASRPSPPIDGAARGGMTIAISCDMIIAGDASTFGYPEIDVGLIPAIHFVQLPRLVGKHRAFGPLFLGEPFDAATALPHGACSAKSCPKGTALDRAREVARRLAAKSPDRHEDRPRCLHAARSMPISAARSRTRPRVLRLSRPTEDCQEGPERVRRKADAKLQGTLMAGLYFEEFEVGQEFHHRSRAP